MGNSVNVDNPNPEQLRKLQQTNREFAMSFVQENVDLNEARGLFHNFFQPNLLDKIRLRKTHRKELPFQIINSGSSFSENDVVEFEVKHKVPLKIKFIFNCYFKKRNNRNVTIVQNRPRDTTELVIPGKNDAFKVHYKIPKTILDEVMRFSHSRINHFPFLIVLEAVDAKEGETIQVCYSARRKEASQELLLTEEYIVKKSELYVVSDVFWVSNEQNHVDKDSSSKAQSTAGDSCCIICFGNRVDCLLIPCRHMSLCLECSRALQNSTNKCPICRETVREIVQINTKSRK